MSYAYLYKYSIILKCQSETYLALCSCSRHMVALPLKVVALLFLMSVKVIALPVAYFQLTGLLPFHILAEPCLVVLKHYGKREVLHLIDQMEDCFDCPFEFNPEAIESGRRMRGASAVEPAQWGYGINVYGKGWKYQAKASEKSTLNAAMYGFRSDKEYSRVQAYLYSHGDYQLEAVSTGHILLGRRSP